MKFRFTCSRRVGSAWLVDMVDGCVPVRPSVLVFALTDSQCQLSSCFVSEWHPAALEILSYKGDQLACRCVSRLYHSGFRHVARRKTWAVWPSCPWGSWSCWRRANLPVNHSDHCPGSSRWRRFRHKFMIYIYSGLRKRIQSGRVIIL